MASPSEKETSSTSSGGEDEDRSQGSGRLSIRKAGILTVLYLVQGLPFGFFLFTFTLHLREQRLSLAKITFISAVNLPWLLKFLWAPLADKYFWPSVGRRRSWILPAQGLLVVSLAVTGLLSHSLDLLGLMAFLTLVNFCAATQDIGVDGLAVDILEEHERGVGNSVQAAAYKIGMLGGGFGLTWILPHVGIKGCFFVMAGAVAVGMLVPVFLREGPVVEASGGGEEASGGGVEASGGGEEASPESIPFWSLFKSLFTRPGAPAFFAFILLVKVGDAIANPLFRLFLKDSGVSLSQINWSMNLAGMAATLIGSALCGFFIKFMGRRWALWITLVGQGLSHLAWAGLTPLGSELKGPALGWLYTVALWEHLVSGMLTVVVFTLMMDAVRKEVGSSQYTLLMCLHLGTAFIVGMGSGAYTQWLGYGVAFGTAGVFTLACGGLLPVLERRGYLAGHIPSQESHG